MKVVIDANIGVALVLPLPYSSIVEEKVRLWQEGDYDIYVPALWSYEVVSAIRKAVVLKKISPEESEQSLQLLFSLGIQEQHLSLSHFQKTLKWAFRINHTVAYGAAYLALAEDLGAKLWTADQKLVNAARQAGAGWVNSVKDWQD